MAIKGVTDSGPRFPRIGVLRKGGVKPERGPGQDLEYFRFTSDIPGLEDEFRAIYGDKPAELEVVLPYATAEANFEAWNEHWVAGSLKHRCDGVQVTRLQNADLSYSRWPEGAGPACPGECKPRALLHLILGELIARAGHAGIVTVPTGSVYEIARLAGELRTYEEVAGPRGLALAPFILSRRPTEISVPREIKGEQKRVRQTKWLVHLEPAPAWVRGRFQSALEVEDIPVLEDDEDGPPRLVDEQTGEVMMNGRPPAQQEAPPPPPPPFEEEMKLDEYGRLPIPPAVWVALKVQPEADWTELAHLPPDLLLRIGDLPARNEAGRQIAAAALALHAYLLERVT